MTGTIEEHAVSGSKIWNNDKSLKEKWVKLSDAQEHIYEALKRSNANYEACEELQKKIDSFRDWLEKGYNMAFTEQRFYYSFDKVIEKFNDTFYTVEGVASTSHS